MLLLGALALTIPAIALAGGGGSAGDQQYTDPFAGTSPGKSTSTRSTPATSTQSATPPPTTATQQATTPVPSTQTSSDPTTPTATIASSSTQAQLPRTGYDSWEAGVLGFVLVAGGLGLRAHLRRG
jgi:hypothetical protein